jgi:hypothetical protein
MLGFFVGVNTGMLKLLPPLHTQLDPMYRVNSQGYRCAEFSTESFDSVWLFGCSYAFGWGVCEADTISSQLTSVLGEPVLNLAQGGSSIRYQCDQLALLLSQGLRPRRVCVVWPDTGRWPWYGSEGSDQPALSQDLYLAHSADPVYMSARARMDITEFRLMCELINVPLAELTWSLTVQESISGPRGFERGYEWSFPQFDLALDSQHPGPLSMRLACDEFILQWAAQ